MGAGSLGQGSQHGARVSIRSPTQRGRPGERTAHRAGQPRANLFRDPRAGRAAEDFERHRGGRQEGARTRTGALRNRCRRRVSVVQAQTTLENVQAQAINVGLARAQFEHAIAMLIGKPTSGFSIPVKPMIVAPPPIPIGVPSQLLERRPDIAAAERNMAEANAQIGIATAAFYPTLTLSAAGGVESSTLDRLFGWSSRVWSIGGTLSETIFDAGLRRATVNQFIATYNAAVAGYRQTVLTAFQQVEDSLAAVRILSQQVVKQQQAVNSAETRPEARTGPLRDRHRSLSQCGDRADHASHQSADTGHNASVGNGSRRPTDHGPRRRLGSLATPYSRTGNPEAHEGRHHDSQVGQASRPVPAHPTP